MSTQTEPVTGPDAVTITAGLPDDVELAAVIVVLIGLLTTAVVPGAATTTASPPAWTRSEYRPPGAWTS